jgi:fucose permease
MPSVAGYQLAAASVGAAVVPGAIGIVVAGAGLTFIPAILALAAAGLVTATVALGRRPIPAQAQE